MHLLGATGDLTALAQAMTAIDATGWYAQVHDYGWGRHKRVIDVGGSLGSLTAKLLTAYPHMQGVVFDLPATIDKARAVWATEHKALLPRATLVSGSFFDAATIPKAHDGDAYLM